MTKTSVFKLVSMKKGVERTHLEKLLMRLRLEHDELGQRTRYIDQVTQEYEVDLGKFEEAVRFDGPALAGRRYLVQLMSMKNAVVIKQMDLELKMERVRNALQQIASVSINSMTHSLTGCSAKLSASCSARKMTII